MKPPSFPRINFYSSRYDLVVVVGSQRIQVNELRELDFHVFHSHCWALVVVRLLGNYWALVVVRLLGNYWALVVVRLLGSSQDQSIEASQNRRDQGTQGADVLVYFRSDAVHEEKGGGEKKRTAFHDEVMHASQVIDDCLAIDTAQENVDCLAIDMVKENVDCLAMDTAKENVGAWVDHACRVCAPGGAGG